jgi:hypothetical protein
MLNLAFYSENDLLALNTSGLTIYKKDAEKFSLFKKNQTGFTGMNQTGFTAIN